MKILNSRKDQLYSQEEIKEKEQLSPLRKHVSKGQSKDDNSSALISSESPLMSMKIA
jgi:hypothetical protein